MNVKKYTFWRAPDDPVEMACDCNYHTSPLIIDFERLIIFCSHCGHEESFPEYAMKFPEEGIKDYYVHPLKEDQTRDRAMIEVFKNGFWSTIRRTV